MKKTAVCLLLVCSTLCKFVEAQQLHHSDIRVSLLTAAPGEEIYAVFGHSAIRIKIEKLGHDAVYNYGTFSFNQPNFVANFARGKMLYYLSVSSFDSFMASYMYENRKMREQVFDLDSVQTIFMVEFLQNNYNHDPYYLYHFFLDNCATRIRDLLITFDDNEKLDGYRYYFREDSATRNNSVRAILKSKSFPQSQDNPTFRALIHSYLGQHHWGRFGIDIGLGLPTDQKTGIFEQMFLPDYLFDAFAKVMHNGAPVVKETKTIFTPDPNRPAAILPPSPVTPTVVCSLILTLAVIFLFVRKAARIFDFTLFFATGLTGLLITFLWFFTEHTFTQNNLNIIWALPTHVVMAFLLLPKRGKGNKFVRQYFLATAVVAMLLLLTWAFLPQRLNPALIPLVLAISIRAFRNSKKIRVN